MDTPKKTGLGSSLLLRRTVTPPVPPDSPVVLPAPSAVIISEPVPAPLPSPEPIQTPPLQSPQQAPKPPLVLRDRCTLYITREVNEQLHVTARIEGRERSEIVSDLLRKYLPRYRIERQEEGSESSDQISTPLEP